MARAASGGGDVPPRVPTILDCAAAMADRMEDVGDGPRGRGPVDLRGTHTVRGFLDGA